MSPCNVTVEEHEVKLFARQRLCVAEKKVNHNLRINVRPHTGSVVSCHSVQ